MLEGTRLEPCCAILHYLLLGPPGPDWTGNIARGRFFLNIGLCPLLLRIVGIPSGLTEVASCSDAVVFPFSGKSGE